MASSGLVRWGGPAAMLGGVLSIVFAFVGEGSWVHVPLDAARYALLVVGIVGIYLRRSTEFGRLGALGFHVCVFVFALIALLDLGIINKGMERTYIAFGPVRGPLLLVGLLLFGAAVVRTGRLARGGAWLLIAAALTNVVGHRRHDHLWWHAGWLSLHSAHGAIWVRMGLAGVQPLV